MTNHKKVTDVTASLDGNCLGILKVDQSVKMP